MKLAFLKPASASAAAAFLLLTAPLYAGARKNLIIIGWDTLRADHVSALGYARKTTPNMDAFAGGAFLFTDAVSQASWTLPAFMSIFTSLYPSEHQVTNKFRITPGSSELLPVSLSTGAVTLAEALKARGYSTAAFTGGAGVGGEYGFSRGFDVYADSRNFAGFGTTFPEALAWLKKNGDKPFFLFVHGYDTHPFHNLVMDGKYSFIGQDEAQAAAGIKARHEKMRLDLLDGKKPEHTDADVRLWTDVYDEKILRTDRLLGEFLKNLAARGKTAENTVIIVVADHGEELFDHGGVDHGMTLYDEMIHVPLIIRVPGRRGRVIKGQVRTLDIFPTVLDLLGIKPPDSLKGQLRGTSLAGYMAGEKGARTAFSETDYLFHFSKRAIRKSGGLKLIEDGFTQGRELYDTAADAREKKDLAEEDPARSYVLEMELSDQEDALTPVP